MGDTSIILDMNIHNVLTCFSMCSLIMPLLPYPLSTPCNGRTRVVKLRTTAGVHFRNSSQCEAGSSLFVKKRTSDSPEWGPKEPSMY